MTATPATAGHAGRAAPVVDSHCHLTYPGLVEQQAPALERARAVGVAGMVNIATKLREWDAVLAIAEREPDVWATVGIHPHESEGDVVDPRRLVDAAAHPRIVGIGETGLDFYYDHSDRLAQERSFRSHIAAARETGLPIIVHSRDAEDRTAAIFEQEMEQGGFRGVIHCFTGSRAFAERALALGFYVSLSGILTFRNARDLQETAKALPLDRLLVETDAPFLAPVPVRGQPGEPSFVRHTLRFLAGLRGMSEDELAAITTANFLRLFAKATLPCG